MSAELMYDEPVVSDEPADMRSEDTDSVREAAQVPSDPVESPRTLSYEQLRPGLEAILLVVDEPVTDEILAQVLECPKVEVTQALERLAAEYLEQGRGFDLRNIAGGWRLYTREEYAAFVERFVLDGQQTRLTQAALETLAVVAYRQPVTRTRISGIRGVNCDGVMRTLLARGLVEECGADNSGGYLYQTTSLFLEKLGLSSINELPPIAPLMPDTDAVDDVIAGD